MDWKKNTEIHHVAIPWITVIRSDCIHASSRIFCDPQWKLPFISQSTVRNFYVLKKRPVPVGRWNSQICADFVQNNDGTERKHDI